MREPLSIDRARPGDGQAVARMISRSLPGKLRRLTIWASPHSGRYVEALLNSRRRTDDEFYLLRSGGRPAGVAAFRMVGGSAFLNHLYVAPGLRGRSLGRRLLAAAAAQYLARHASDRVALDVFSPRPLIENWYARLGLTRRRRRLWSIASPDRLDAGSSKLEKPWHSPNKMEADRQHRAFGFSSLVIALSGGRRYDVGRLYAPYFRLTETEAAADPVLRWALKRLDPRRRLLLVAPGLPMQSPWRQAAVSQRLEGSATTFLERLARKGTG